MNKTLLSIILTILLAGGTYGGYKVIRDNNADVFENSYHPVIGVIDGDTIKIPSYKGNNETIRVRLIGVNAPEEGECFYKQSQQYLRNLLSDKEIKIERDIESLDIYDRLLRYVFLVSDDVEDDYVFVNQEILKNGYAVWKTETPNNRYNYLLSSAQQNAIKKKLGIWAVCDMSEYWDEQPVGTQINNAEPSSPECTIKGNISERGFGKIYFVEGCPNYGNVKVDTRKGEQYFCSAEEAEDFGFKRAESCPE